MLEAGFSSSTSSGISLKAGLIPFDFYRRRLLEKETASELSKRLTKACSGQKLDHCFLNFIDVVDAHPVAGDSGIVCLNAQQSQFDAAACKALFCSMGKLLWEAPVGNDHQKLVSGSACAKAA